MPTITPEDKKALIRLASSMPRGSRERREILVFVAKDTLEDQKFTNPETGNKVNFTSLPAKEQARIRGEAKGEGDEEGGEKGEGKDEEKGKEKPGDAARDKVKGWLAKAKGLTDKAKKTLQSLPEKGQKFVSDPTYRKEVTSAAAKELKAAPKKFAKNVIHTMKHEVKETGEGLKRMSQGKLPTKPQAKAMAGLAVEVAVAALSIHTAGAFGAGAALTKSLAKHVALTAMNPLLGDAYVFGLEGSHLLHAVEGFLHIAAEKGSTDPEKFVEDLVKAVGDAMEKGLSDEAVIASLNDEGGEE